MLHSRRILMSLIGRAAPEAARRWAFQPATLEGDPVKVHSMLTVNHQLGSRSGPG